MAKTKHIQSSEKIDTVVYAIKSPTGRISNLHPDWRHSLEGFTGGFRSKRSSNWIEAQKRGFELIKVHISEL